jgi:hypothetical protein
MQRYTVYLYLETALHVSGGTSIHHQERKQLYLQHLVFVTPLLLSAAIVEELEPVYKRDTFLEQLHETHDNCHHYRALKTYSRIMPIDRHMQQRVTPL